MADDSWRKSDDERRLEAKERRSDDVELVNFWLDPDVSPSPGQGLSKESAEELTKIRAAAAEIQRGGKDASTTANYLREKLGGSGR